VAEVGKLVGTFNPFGDGFSWLDRALDDAHVRGVVFASIGVKDAGRGTDLDDFGYAAATEPVSRLDGDTVDAWDTETAKSGVPSVREAKARSGWYLLLCSAVIADSAWTKAEPCRPALTPCRKSRILAVADGNCR
jgi:hypothetical protein